MKARDLDSPEVPHEKWEASLQSSDPSVEALELHSGATLILSQFAPGVPRSFSFTEPEDSFGIGFHLKGGARFDMEGVRFGTRPFEVWAGGGPCGATSQFVLPPGGFRTVSIRFEPTVAEEFFAEGLALPKQARDILKRVREHAGVARLAPLTVVTASRLEKMFTTTYDDAARRLYLESCALDLLAAQIAHASDGETGSPKRRHRQKALAARDHLDTQLQNPPTIAQLSKIVGTNEFTLKRAFKEALGTTIFSYVSRRRMERATFLLEQGMTVSSAAREVGYSCVRSFSAAFRRHVGYPPSVIRRTDL